MSTLNSKFKKCPNGHYYDASLPSCPYCPKDGSQSVGNGGTQTIGGMNGGAQTIGQMGGTKPIDGFANGTTKTIDISGNSNGMSGTATLGGDTIGTKPTDGGLSGRTITFVDVIGEDGKIEKVESTRRKLVGWLVSYTLDEMGMDFKLYEGRNIIGRDIDCNITVSDKSVSGKHATILYREGIFSISDKDSTSGTFVNEKFIDLESVHLNDGDTIKVGKTVFKFRTAY